MVRITGLIPEVTVIPCTPENISRDTYFQIPHLTASDEQN